VLTPEFLRTSFIQRFSCGVFKGDQFPKVLGTGEGLDRLIVEKCVRRSRVVRKSDYLEDLECDCGSVQDSRSSEAQNES
jgi:hypothetical protein